MAARRFARVRGCTGFTPFPSPEDRARCLLVAGSGGAPPPFRSLARPVFVPLGDPGSRPVFSGEVCPWFDHPLFEVRGDSVLGGARAKGQGTCCDRCAHHSPDPAHAIDSSCATIAMRNETLGRTPVPTGSWATTLTSVRAAPRTEAAAQSSGWSASSSGLDANDRGARRPAHLHRSPRPRRVMNTRAVVGSGVGVGSGRFLGQCEVRDVASE